MTSIEQVTQALVKFVDENVEIKVNDTPIPLKITRTSDLSKNELDVSEKCIYLNIQHQRDVEHFKHINDGGYSEGTDRVYWTFRKSTYLFYLYSDVIPVEQEFVGVLDSEYINFDVGVKVNSIRIENVPLKEKEDWKWDDLHHKRIKIIKDADKYLGRRTYISCMQNIGGEHLVTEAVTQIRDTIKNYIYLDIPKFQYLRDLHLDVLEVGDEETLPQQMYTETLHGARFKLDLTYYHQRRAKDVLDERFIQTVENVDVETKNGQ